MLHQTVWDAPSASSKKEVSFRLETGVENVTSNCMGRAVRQFEKQVSFKLRAVGQFEKEVSFKLGRICYIELYGTRRPPVR